MTRFDIGSQIVSTHEPNKIGVVYNIINKDTKPIYFVKYPDGSEYANYEEAFNFAEFDVKISMAEVLNNGQCLLEDFIINDSMSLVFVSVIYYNRHIYYYKTVNEEVEEFKELT